MTQSNKNPGAVVLLRAYDKNGELVDTLDVHGRHAPELLFIDFADEARTLYKAVRITMEVAYD